MHLGLETSVYVCQMCEKHFAQRGRFTMRQTKMIQFKSVKRQMIQMAKS